MRLGHTKVHLIRRQDLEAVDDEEIDGVKMHNAVLMNELGWEGVHKAAQR